MTDDDRIAEIRARWLVIPQPCPECGAPNQSRAAGVRCGVCGERREEDVDDSAPEDIAYLLARVEELEEQLARMEAVVEAARSVTMSGPNPYGVRVLSEDDLGGLALAVAALDEEEGSP